MEKIYRVCYKIKGSQEVNIIFNSYEEVTNLIKECFNKEVELFMYDEIIIK